MPSSERPERKALGFWMCLALVVGNVIGTGIFLLPATLAPYGLNALFGWLITIAGGLCLAYVFAALAREMPEAGGPYGYIGAAMGPPAAFFVMWSYWISLWVTNAAVAIGAVSYLTRFAPALANTKPAGPILAIFFVLLFTAIASRGVRAAGGVQLVTSILKVMPLLAVIILAIALLGRGDAAPGGFAPMPVSGGSIAAAAALSLWAILGLEAATVPAGKVRDPERIVPKTTLIGTLLVGLICLLTCSAVWLLMPADEAAKSSAPLADLVAGYWGPAAAGAVAAFAAISALGALNGWILLQAEVPLALARNGVFPRAFARVNRLDMPVFGQWLGCLLTVTLIATSLSRGLAGIFEFMILLATAATLVLYLAAAVAALLLVRRKRLRGPLIAGTAAAAALYSAWTFYGAGSEATGWGAVLVASGVPVYLIMRRSKMAPQKVASDDFPSNAGAESLSSREEAITMSDTDPDAQLNIPESEWRKRLSPEQYHVLREAGTERAFTGRYVDNKEKGQYLCAGCGQPLFESDTKYDSGSGWPSFTAPAEDEAVVEHADTSYGMRRVEVRCSRCDGHLGHVFDDGPGPQGLRYCINSASLDFDPRP